MTENEAIKELEEQISLYEWQAEDIDKVINPKRREEYQNAISAFKAGVEALKEIQQYRSIGTVEECRKAVEKQRERRLDFREEDTPKHMLSGMLAPFCPFCGGDLLDSNNDCFAFCPECGQRIYWREWEK